MGTQGLREVRASAAVVFDFLVSMPSDFMAKDLGDTSPPGSHDLLMVTNVF